MHDNDLNIAISHHNKGDFPNAEKHYVKSIEENENPIAYFKLGVIYNAKNDPQNSELFFAKAIELDPLYSEAYENLGKLYYDNNLLELAEECYNKAIGINPEQANVHLYLGELHKSNNDIQKALLHFQNAIKINQNLEQAYLNIGNIYFSIDNALDAKFYYKKAISINPNNSLYYNNLASCYKELNELQKAKENYNKALSINPNYISSLYNLSYIYLIEKEYTVGFNQYRHRYNEEIRGDKLGGVAYYPTLLRPTDKISNKTVYISHEQGLGDTLQFIRFIPFFLEKSARIICYVPPSLKKLFEYNYPDVNFIFPDSKISFDYNFPMLESPYLLGTTYENIPYGNKYLSVDKDDLLEFKKNHHISEHTKKIGINYRGSQGGDAVKNRSCELSLLIKHLKELDNNIQIYSLQYERTPEEDILLKNNNIINLGSHIKDFYDTALMIESMDMVISSDTSVLHLAGAMGKESIAMLKFAVDWRWGINETKTKWYESITIIRQKTVQDWESVLKDVIRTVKEKFNQ